MNHAPSPAWFGLAFPVIFVGMWLLVLHMLAWLGGWRGLAKSYGSSEPLDGERFWFKSGRLGSVNYNGVLTLTAGRSGLRMAVILPFRPAHRALTVPWSDITATAHRGWVFEYVDLRFAKQPQTRLRVVRSLAVALIAAGGSYTPINAA